MDDDDRLTADLARDLDGHFERLVLAHQDRLYTIALRMLGEPRDAEEAAQDALVRAYRALATYDADRIRELRLRGWLATIVLNLCRTRAARRAARGPAPASIDAERPVRNGARAGRRRECRPGRDRRAPGRPVRMGGPLGGVAAGLPRRRRAPPRRRPVLSETAAALGRPEGTVKAQVHRGIALLRTMVEAAEPARPPRS